MDIGHNIMTLRKQHGITQEKLAAEMGVSMAAVSKWETGKGLPDIGVIEELAGALGVSIAELLTGELRENGNKSANMRKMCFYVCPVCGNIITSVGHGTFSCCGITLPEVEAEKDEEGHCICVETADNEHSVTIQHPMGKGHYISFIAYVTTDALNLVKLYPEQGISVRFIKKVMELSMHTVTGMECLEQWSDVGYCGKASLRRCFFQLLGASCIIQI